MNTLGQVVIVIGLTIIGAIAYWVYRKDQQEPVRRTPLEWERITGIQITDYAAWTREGVSLVDPITRDEYIRLAKASPSKHRDKIP